MSLRYGCPMRPNVFIVGAPKCGTSAWVRYLRDHPQIFFSAIKEPHYFCTDLAGFREITNETDYLSLFDGAEDAEAIGEASVFYLFSTVAAEEIRSFNPQARIIIFLREQEDFLPSMHHQFLYSFQESIEDFAEAFRLSGNRGPGEIPLTCKEQKLLDYRALGKFSEQVERFLTCFPRDQVRIYFFRDWVRDPRSTYLDILRFLGIEDDGRTEFQPVNEAKYHRLPILGRLAFFPPPWVRYPVALVKKLLGKESLGIAEIVGKYNRGSGYKTHVTPEIKDHLKQLYENDNRRLKERIARVKSE